MFPVQHSTWSELTRHFRWETGSLPLWDSRCTQHLAINDYPAETITMQRITVCGNTPS
jgi:taurine dioxygenase